MEPSPFHVHAYLSELCRQARRARPHANPLAGYTETSLLSRTRQTGIGRQLMGAGLRLEGAGRAAEAAMGALITFTGRVRRTATRGGHLRA